jgi:putative ABC transport system permease protein
MEMLLQEVRYALRNLRQTPGFTLSAVVILALGIGGVTALFTVLDGVLLKPLHYPDASRIVAILNRYEDRTAPNLTGGDEVDIHAEAGVFEAFAYYHGGEMGVQLADRAEFVGARLVHPDFFRVFGLVPVAGRPFNLDDAQQSAIVSVGFAQRNFGSAAAALSQSVFIENRPYVVVGVMPAAMQFPANTDVWAAAPLEPSNRNRTGHNYRAVAKLAAGLSVEVANARLAVLAERLAAAFPVSNRGKSFVAVPLRDTLVSQARTTLFVLMGAVALLLLIACANVANLMLARGAVRARDVAVRVALGAARRRIIGQSLIESLALAAMACGLGVTLAYAGTHALLQIGGAYVPLPRLDDIQMDWRVLVFSVGVSLFTTLTFGLVPAIQASRVSVKETLNRGGTRGSIGGSSALRSGLVVAQIALSFMLAINAGLLLRSFVSLTDTPLGFERQRILVMYAHAPARGSIFDQSGLEDYLRVGRFFDEVLARLRQLPNVTAAGAAMGLPTGQYSSNGSYAVEGKHTFSGDFRLLPSAGFRLASPGYFETLGIPLVSGRDFNDGDVYDRPFVAIVSQSLARQSFGDEDPLGHRIMCGLDQPDKWMTIVGVVGDVRQASPASQPGPELYMPLRQHPYAANEVQVAIRSRVSPESLIGTVQQIVRSANPEVAMKFTTLEASVDNSIAAPRFRATLTAIFASLALLLALGGVYAVMSYVTAQRMAEFGLRVALGAASSDVVRLVLARATRLTIIGITIGVVLALGTSRIVTTLLFGITGTDVPTYIGVLLAAMPLVIAAAAVPAIRAARVDPMVTLRAE